MALPPEAVARVERYCADSNGRWWLYDHAAPARDVAPLLAAIDADVTGIFRG
jgi:hypothetical protein